jgi:hypothetical protein
MIGVGEGEARRRWWGRSGGHHCRTPQVPRGTVPVHELGGGQGVRHHQAVGTCTHSLCVSASARLPWVALTTADTWSELHLLNQVIDVKV